MRVPSFLPKSLWSATAIESIVDVVTPITTTSSNRLSRRILSELLDIVFEASGDPIHR